jgi:hypothetical protein
LVTPILASHGDAFVAATCVSVRGAVKALLRASNGRSIVTPVRLSIRRALGSAIKILAWHTVFAAAASLRHEAVTGSVVPSTSVARFVPHRTPRGRGWPAIRTRSFVQHFERILAESPRGLWTGDSTTGRPRSRRLCRVEPSDAARLLARFGGIEMERFQ